MGRAGGDAMLLEFDTSLAAGTEVLVPLFNVDQKNVEPELTSIDVTIDWGDGTIGNYATGGWLSHTYAEEGVYEVSVTGEAGHFGAPRQSSPADTFPERANLRRCTSYGEIGLTSLSLAFALCPNLVEIPLRLPQGSTVQTMEQFVRKAAVWNQDITGWVPPMNLLPGLFVHAEAFNQPVAHFEVSGAADLSSIFARCSLFNQDVSGWDVSSVQSLFRAFFMCPAFNRDIGGWDTSKVKDFEGMFEYASAFNQDLSTWDVSSALTFRNMFGYASAFNQDLSAWPIPDGANLSGMLNNCGMSAENYSRTLIGWANTDFAHGRTLAPSLGAGGLQYDDVAYTSGQQFNDAVSARAYLINEGWVIAGDSQVA